MNPDDISTHAGDDYDKHLGAISPPIYQNSLFTRKRGGSGYSYTRVSNPTTEVAEKIIAGLEHGEEARCFASGMAAITSTVLHFVKTGTHIIAPVNIYMPMRYFLSEYLTRFGVEVTFVEGDDPSDFEKALRPKTGLIYMESPSSNIFRLQDLAEVAKIAQANNIPTMADNSWATPIFQNPLTFGVDVVVHSASKYLGGHSDIVGGAITGGSELITDIANKQRSVLGAVMDPHQSWLLARSLRTLPVRMRQHQENGRAVAEFLENHKKVEQVLYPGLESHPQYKLGRKQMSGYSSLMSFVPAGTDEEIREFTRKLRHFEEGPSWGGYESLLNTPGVGIDAERSKDNRTPRGLVRLSIGLENSNTLLEDLDQALTEIGN
ncbi:MAG: aminotransferase class I/II-fold pyridoxal phosphate-dependent enzyme [Spirochaetales bacterium]|jgi:cystathionine beta-lyase/cystathionine gamma-synthase|nr:aminotransferase class I/II-fold pyridoxal phosphate-dependent enzyme [Spirochaetales bacterium]